MVKAGTAVVIKILLNMVLLHLPINSSLPVRLSDPAVT